MAPQSIPLLCITAVFIVASALSEKFIHFHTVTAFQVQHFSRPRHPLPRSRSRPHVNSQVGFVRVAHTHLANSNNNDNQEVESPSSSSSSSPTSSLPQPTVLCVGETLWDSLPSGMYLGGAPSNVAAHLASLFQGAESNVNNEDGDSGDSSESIPTVAIATCVGNDQLGLEARRRLELKGVRTDFIQYHSEWETGMSIAMINQNGDATYEFNTPAAWDGLKNDDKIMKLVDKTTADAKSNKNEDESNKQSAKVLLVMGTIAARLDDEHGATSASSLMAIRNTAPEGTVILDVNLRSPWYTPERVLKLARGTADSSVDENATFSTKKLALLKLNEDELVVLEGWCGLTTPTDDNGKQFLSGAILKERMEKLAASLNTQRLCVTRGEDGAALWCQGDDEDDETTNGKKNGGTTAVFCENSGYSLNSHNKGGDSDTVGAGDAFLASLINSHLICEEPPEVALKRACALGGYVAGCRGATPEHGDAPLELRKIFSSKLY